MNEVYAQGGCPMRARSPLVPWVSQRLATTSRLVRRSRSRDCRRARWWKSSASRWWRRNELVAVVPPLLRNVPLASSPQLTTRARISMWKETNGIVYPKPQSRLKCLAIRLSVFRFFNTRARAAQNTHIHNTQRSAPIAEHPVMEHHQPHHAGPTTMVDKVRGGSSQRAALAAPSCRSNLSRSSSLITPLSLALSVP